MSGPVPYDQPPFPTGPAVGYAAHGRQNGAFQPSPSTSSSLSMYSSTSSSLGGLGTCAGSSTCGGGSTPSGGPSHPSLITPQMQQLHGSGSNPGGPSSEPLMLLNGGQYLPHGEPSMRPSVDGIPQFHVASSSSSSPPAQPGPMVQPIAVSQFFYDPTAPQPMSDFRFGAIPSSSVQGGPSPGTGQPQPQVVGSMINNMSMGIGPVGPSNMHVPPGLGGPGIGMGMGMRMGEAVMNLGGMAGINGIPGQGMIEGVPTGMTLEMAMGMGGSVAGMAVDGLAGEWEDDFDEEYGGMLNGNLEVKHRRRTTPEQLRVLEHWFSINPRPDNALREWLANELGITKRNVQVWFQNRRAKIKNQEKAREAATAEATRLDGAPDSAGSGTSTVGGGPGSGSKSDGPSPTISSEPPSANPLSQSRPNTAGPGDPLNSSYSASSHLTSYSPSTGQHPEMTATNQSNLPLIATTQSGQPLIAVPDHINMGRRVSLAGGETAMIEQWVIRRATASAKRQAAMANVGGIHIPGAYQLPRTQMTSTDSANSPLGMAAAARRGSQPYPPPIVTHLTEDGQFALGPGPRTALHTVSTPSFIVNVPFEDRNGSSSSQKPGTLQQQQLQQTPGSAGSGNGSPSTASSAGQGQSLGQGPILPSPSPKVSPNGRMPSALHFTAMRNNTIRRASMPGVAQLVSTVAFTPPRNASSNHPMPGASVGGNGLGVGTGGRELSPIKDHEHADESRLDQRSGVASRMPVRINNMGQPITYDSSTSYLTPPSSSYMSSDGSRMSSEQNPDSAGSNKSFDLVPAAQTASVTAPAGSSNTNNINSGPQSAANAYAFSPNSPLPNPAFSFGSAAPMPSSGQGMEVADGGGGGGGVGTRGVGIPGASDENGEAANQAQALWTALQRGRLGSIASIASTHTVTTEEGVTESGSIGGDAPGRLIDWTNLLPPGFDPDLRRASAPADLLHNMGVLGISSSPGASHLHLVTSNVGASRVVVGGSRAGVGGDNGVEIGVNGPSSSHLPSSLATAYSQQVVDRGIPLTAPVPIGLPSVYLQQRQTQAQAQVQAQGQNQSHLDESNSPPHSHTHTHFHLQQHPGLSPLSNPGSGVSSENHSPASHHTQSSTNGVGPAGRSASLMPPPPLPSRNHSMYTQPTTTQPSGAGAGGYGTYGTLSQGQAGIGGDPRNSQGLDEAMFTQMQAQHQLQHHLQHQRFQHQIQTAATAARPQGAFFDKTSGGMVGSKSDDSVNVGV